MYNNQKSRRTYSQEKNKGNYDKVIKQKFPLKFTDESYVDEARKIIEIFKGENFEIFYNKRKKERLTNTQLRNLLAMTSAVYDEARNNGFDHVNEKIAYLKVQFIYQSGRNLAVKVFVEVAQLVELVDKIRDLKKMDDLLRFCHYMEALIAYFKYYGGADK
ncbi:type III-A CRISPR-associated protein Csm2 [Ligilactobacillus salivarius]|uniref:type III-A CRISPR-associated protein Csm2 n=1 Tax=Ligilactobacillus salivarius TaxID=1624 RepID=UPI0009DA8626|nr:type III-A CRISPR-associated protein Csm2 [Ligilactobacillus salivarius]OQQ80699.1 type III-A CRISPR-associated protein Csm2 [Ligilactobacillus salivarius]